MSDLGTEAVGWVATGILIATVGRQAWTQAKSRSTAGLSRWLFVGQLAASTGFTIYSFLLGNVVFVVSNLFLLAIAAIGQVLYLRNRRREASQSANGPQG